MKVVIWQNIEKMELKKELQKSEKLEKILSDLSMGYETVKTAKRKIIKLIEFDVIESVLNKRQGYPPILPSDNIFNEIKSAHFKKRLNENR
jgi:hypothetical protein